MQRVASRPCAATALVAAVRPGRRLVQVAFARPRHGPGSAGRRAQPQDDGLFAPGHAPIPSRSVPASPPRARVTRPPGARHRDLLIFTSRLPIILARRIFPASRPEARMALTTQTMTDEQRKSVALEYLKAFDNGGVTSTGGSILDLFADDAQVYFPKWGLANGKERDRQAVRRRRRTLKSITHHYSHFNWIFSGSDIVVARGHQPRRAPGRPVAGRRARVGRRPLVRRVRDPRLEDPARASSTSTPTTPARTPRAIPGWPTDLARHGMTGTRSSSAW